MRAPVPALIAYLTNKSAQAFDAGYYDLIQDFEYGTMNMLSLYLDNVTTFNTIMDHGCHCARFDPQSSKRMLGGGHAVDQLDDLCKSWYQARMCLNRYDRGSCKNLDNQDYGYQVTVGVDINDSSPDTVQCNEFHSTTLRQYNECELDSCKVDIYYVQLIKNTVELDNDFSPFVVDDYTTCPRGGSAPAADGVSTRYKYCDGEAPLVHIVSGVAGQFQCAEDNPCISYPCDDSPCGACCYSTYNGDQDSLDACYSECANMKADFDAVNVAGQSTAAPVQQVDDTCQEDNPCITTPCVSTACQICCYNYYQPDQDNVDTCYDGCATMADVHDQNNSASGVQSTTATPTTTVDPSSQTCAEEHVCTISPCDPLACNLCCYNRYNGLNTLDNCYQECDEMRDDFESPSTTEARAKANHLSTTAQPDATTTEEPTCAGQNPSDDTACNSCCYNTFDQSTQQTELDNCYDECNTLSVSGSTSTTSGPTTAVTLTDTCSIDNACTSNPCETTDCNLCCFNTYSGDQPSINACYDTCEDMQENYETANPTPASGGTTTTLWSTSNGEISCYDENPCTVSPCDTNNCSLCCYTRYNGQSGPLDNCYAACTAGQQLFETGSTSAPTTEAPTTAEPTTTAQPTCAEQNICTSYPCDNNACNVCCYNQFDSINDQVDLDACYLQCDTAAADYDSANAPSTQAGSTQAPNTATTLPTMDDTCVADNACTSNPCDTQSCQLCCYSYAGYVGSPAAVDICYDGCAAMKSTYEAANPVGSGTTATPTTTEGTTSAAGEPTCYEQNPCTSDPCDTIGCSLCCFNKYNGLSGLDACYDNCAAGQQAFANGGSTTAAPDTTTTTTATTTTAAPTCADTTPCTTYPCDVADCNLCCYTAFSTLDNDEQGLLDTCYSQCDSTVVSYNQANAPAGTQASSGGSTAAPTTTAATTLAPITDTCQADNGCSTVPCDDSPCRLCCYTHADYSNSPASVDACYARCDTMVTDYEADPSNAASQQTTSTTEATTTQASQDSCYDENPCTSSPCDTINCNLCCFNRYSGQSGLNSCYDTCSTEVSAYEQANNPTASTAGIQLTTTTTAGPTTTGPPTCADNNPCVDDNCIVTCNMCCFTSFTIDQSDERDTCYNQCTDIVSAYQAAQTTAATSGDDEEHSAGSTAAPSTTTAAITDTCPQDNFCTSAPCNISGCQLCCFNEYTGNNDSIDACYDRCIAMGEAYDAVNDALTTTTTVAPGQTTAQATLPDVCTCCQAAPCTEYPCQNLDCNMCCFGQFGGTSELDTCYLQCEAMRTEYDDANGP